MIVPNSPCCPGGSRWRGQGILCDDLVYDDELEWMLLAILPLHPVFNVGYSSCSCDGAHLYCPSRVVTWSTKVARRARSCTAAFFFRFQYERIMRQIDSDKNFNKKTLGYILIVYHVTFKLLVLKCFRILRHRSFSRLSESHNICACFWD